MTNIVGGNTSNFSQLSSTQDGSASNNLSINGGLDFLSLISLVYEGEKKSDGRVSSLGNIEKSVDNAEANTPIDHTKVEQIFSDIGKQVSSDDISAFLKGLNVTSGEDEKNVGISTLQLLGQLSKPGEENSADFTKSQVVTQNFIKELSEYIEANNLNSDERFNLEVSDISARM